MADYYVRSGHGGYGRSDVFQLLILASLPIHPTVHTVVGPCSQKVSCDVSRMRYICDSSLHVSLFPTARDRICLRDKKFIPSVSSSGDRLFESGRANGNNREEVR